MRSYVILFFLTVSFSAFAEAKTLSCLTSTGRHFCFTQKVLSIISTSEEESTITVTAENFYGCEDIYSSVTTMELQKDGSWLSADGKKSLSMTNTAIRFEDKDLNYDYDGLSGMSPFYYSKKQCR